MNKLICAVRFDDICPTMDWKQFYMAIELMDKYNIKPLLGVIPDNKDPQQICDKENHAFWDMVLKLQQRGYEIALHGCYHKYDNLHQGIVTPWKKGNTEFAGNSYENQYNKIKHGKYILNSHGIYTDIFFAPSHSYDETTLRVLYDCGFKYISDGKSELPYYQNGIKCIPCRFFGTPKVRGNGLYVAVCHTSQWKYYPENYEKLVYFCEKYNDKIVPYTELKKLEVGNYYIQKLSEVSYLFFYDFIRKKLAKSRFLSNIYHRIYG